MADQRNALPQHVLVVDRLGADLARYIAERAPSLVVRHLDIDAVTPADLEWADTYVGFRQPSGGVGAVRWVHSTGAGVDGHLFRKPWPAGRLLTRTRGRFGVRIAEYCLARALFVSQRMPELLGQQARHEWNKLTPSDFAGSRAVILGTGDIGASIARLFRAAGAVVSGVSRSGKSTPDFAAVTTIERTGDVVAAARWLILTLPLTEATWRLVGDDVLSLCRGAFLINVARGAVIDHDALGRALDSGALSGAALDVFETEPLPADSPLWGHPQILVSPHCSALTEVHEAGDSFLEAWADLRAGRAPALTVDARHGY